MMFFVPLFVNCFFFFHYRCFFSLLFCVYFELCIFRGILGFVSKTEFFSTDVDVIFVVVQDFTFNDKFKIKIDCLELIVLKCKFGFNLFV